MALSKSRLFKTRLYATKLFGYAVEVFYPYFGAPGDYRHEDKRKPKARIVKKEIVKVADRLLPKKRKKTYYLSGIDTERVAALMQYETQAIVRQYIESCINAKIRQEQDDEDLILLFMV